ncbi:hypothetical protein [Gluconacetobacter tumulicola]|uniref:Core-binding (CB) domain-containing protein n=1 Tax=Gluconacetobacter tumulicola TaxID=1017177 RepID=A0A7W4PB82_9PROT|nr:hypothetical protein [Gluconacetobacter tumulicola]MBB2180870.1 hypothetical protein [Gluconacetobacter tumulicola]
MSTTLPGASKKPYSIYSPSNSKNWYVSFSIKGVGQKRIALRTSDKEQALILAEAVWERETRNDKSESAPKAKTVNQLVEQYIREEKVAPSERTTLTRYVSEYWRFFTPDMITTKMIIGFVKWRKTYWTENAGKTDEYVEYQRGDRTVRRRVSHDIPSDATLKTERSTLRKFLKYCLKERYIAVLPAFPSAPKIEKKKAVAFTNDDITAIGKYLGDQWERSSQSDSSAVPSRLRYTNLMLMAYFDLLRLSGITPRECNALKWDDILGWDFETRPSDHEIPQNITIRIGHPKKPRTVIPLMDFGKSLHLLMLTQMSRGQKLEQSHIWRYGNGQHANDLGEKILAAIKKCRLDIDANGNPRNLESIRIHYIMSVINAVGSVDMVAENVGLTLSALEKLTGIEYRRLERSRELLRIAI